MEKMFASKHDEYKFLTKTESIYTELTKDIKVKKIIVPSKILNAEGKTMYRFIGGPAHGQYTNVKNDTAWSDLQGGGKAFYFFLEYEGVYHYKFWQT